MPSLKGKVAIITGGNDGIGKATARLLARQGVQVVITGRRQDVLDAAVAEIGHGVIGIWGDVAELDHHIRPANDVGGRSGGLDMSIANAGIITLAPSANVTVAEYDQQLAVNRRGVFFSVQSLLRVLRDGGRIILLGSLAAAKALENHAVYAGTKAAIAAFARNWALKRKAWRIRVNILGPGPVDNSVLTKPGISDEGRPDFTKIMGDMNLAGGFGEADELVRTAFFHVRRR